MKDEVVGANTGEVQRKLVSLAASVPKPFGGDGATLGGGSAQVLTPQQAREARLKRFAAPSSGSSDTASAPGNVVCKDGVCRVVPSGPQIGLGESDSSAMNVDGEDADLAAAVALSMDADATNAEVKDAGDAESNAEDDELSSGVGAQLLEMGFNEVRSRKALRSAGESLDACIEWIMAHQEDDDIDDPSTMPARSAPKRELSEEEKEEQQLLIKKRLQERREEREAAEKAADVNREQDRRKTGQEMAKRRDEMQAMSRRREAEVRRKEKMDAKRERQRILAELEKDKRERASNNGKLNSRLGVDGYNPSAIQYDTKDSDATDGTAAAPQAVAAPAPAPAAGIMPNAMQIVDKSIESLSQYRAGGDGGKALDLLSKIVRNLVEHPEEAKFERLNMEGKAYRLKIKGLVGGLRLMQAIGFVKRDADGPHLVLETRDMDVLRNTLGKLEAGLAAYQQR